MRPRNKRSRRSGSSRNQMTTRQKDLESRTASLETKMGEASTKEQALATELQRADNLMEDLTKKDRDLRSREEAAKASEKTMAARETSLVARDAEVRDGMRGLEKLRKEIDDQRGATEEDRRTAKTTRAEAEATKREADKMRAQADEMQSEVNKNLRFLQKKALDVLDQEEKIRARVAAIEGQEKSLDTRAEILDGVVRLLEPDTHTHEPFADPARHSLRLRQGTVGHRSGVLHQSFRSAEADGERRHLDRLDESSARTMASLQLETQHRPEAGHLFAREGVLRK